MFPLGNLFVNLRVGVISVVFDARARMSVGLQDFISLFTGSVHFVFADSLVSLRWLVETLGSVCSQIAHWVVRWSCMCARVCLCVSVCVVKDPGVQIQIA